MRELGNRAASRALSEEESGVLSILNLKSLEERCHLVRWKTARLSGPLDVFQCDDSVVLVLWALRMICSFLICVLKNTISETC